MAVLRKFLMHFVLKLYPDMSSSPDLVKSQIYVQLFNMFTCNLFGIQNRNICMHKHGQLFLGGFLVVFLFLVFFTYASVRIYFQFNGYDKKNPDAFWLNIIAKK